MNRGYVKLWRKSLDNGWLQNHELWAFWSYCLLKASHKKFVVKIGFQEITLLPGQFVFGRKQAAKDLKMSEWQIRACLDFLKKHENLTIKTTNKFSIITIINWVTYQGDDIDEPPANPPTNRQQTATYKNKKYIGTYFSINELQHQKYEEAYPLLDCLEEYKKMEAWLESNPSKRKTERGYPRFVNGWLLRVFKKNKEEENNQGDWRDKYPKL